MHRFRIVILMSVFLFGITQIYIAINSFDSSPGQHSTIDPDKLTPLVLELPEETGQIGNLYAREALLMDGDTGRVLYEKEGYTRAAMASTTKIMTAVYVIENCDLNDIASVSKKAAAQPKVHMGAAEGEKYKVQDLLYALMLESYNDCAVILAEHVSGSVNQFCKAMTEKAKELGCEDTNFETPNGLDSDSHYTTPYDLAKITKYALENETFSDIVRTREYSFSEYSGKRQVTVSNKDSFLSRYEGAIGVKTGFTGKAGYCFVGAVKHDGRYLISVVLGSGWPPHKTYKWDDTIALMKYGEANYKKCQIIKSQNRIGQIEVSHGAASTVPVYIDGSKTTLLSKRDKVETKLHMKKQLEAPVRKNQKAGTLSIYVNEECVETLDIRTVKKMGKETFIMVLEHNIKYMIPGGRYNGT
ncbi:MAG: D-alanyl-D-alanine carboxypeptidase family protein [Lachnospiraceae bacterium]|nr:D-alanyl-D-alanine carboxypeptidase family protein [Lachnospiraceae bacterium]